MDAMININWLIRGMDLITEDCLYLHYCYKFGIKPPVTSYIPRLEMPDGDEISKTKGGYKIHQFREAGMKAQDIIFYLADDCLIDLDNGWTFANIKREPTLSGWAEVINGIFGR
jgi:glutamyl/glutaminyl-tRNA synthetase